MGELLHILAHYVALVVEAMAILIIAFGSLEAALNVARLAFKPHSTNIERRAIWLDFAHWLVAAFTFQLAADVVNTSFAPTWEEIGRLASIAAIRTFLSYFLDHEVESTRKLQHAVTPAQPSEERP